MMFKLRRKQYIELTQASDSSKRNFDEGRSLSKEGNTEIFNYIFKKSITKNI